MTSTEQLFHKVTRVEIDERTAQDLRDILAKAPNWRELEYKAERTGISALVFYCLKEAKLGHLVPLDVWANLRLSYVANSVRNIILTREAELLLEKLAREGIEVMALKGIALLNSVYPHIALRQMCDVDLLVRPEQMERAERVLAENRFRYYVKGELGEEYAKDYVRQPWVAAMDGGVSVEIHRALVSEKSPFAINLDTLWKRAEVIRIGKIEALALSVEDEMHHLAAHLYGHHFAPNWQWRNLCDLAAIVQMRGDGGIDWDYLLRSSKEYKTTGALFLALSALDETLKTAEVKRFLESAKAVIQSNGMFGAIENLERHLPRFDFDALSHLPSTITQIAEESSVLGKARIAPENVSSRKRLIAFRGGEAVRSNNRGWQFLRSLLLVTKYNLNSVRMAYLIGKLSKEIRSAPQRN